MFNRDSLLAKRREPAKQEVSFLGDAVQLREIGALDRVALFELVGSDGGKTAPADVIRLNCALLAKCATDEAGQPLMSGDEWLTLADVEMQPVMDLGKAALGLNKMRGEDVELTAKN